MIVDSVTLVVMIVLFSARVLLMLDPAIVTFVPNSVCRMVRSRTSMVEFST